MKIELTPYGENYREVTFLSAEDDETVARSGLLTRDEALKFADDLRDIAHTLTRWAMQRREDPAQIALPLFGGIAA